MEAILEVKNVSRSFRVGFWMKSVEIIHDVSFSVARNSIYGFLGANGAGKTTLISMIVGLRRPSSGQIRVSGFLSESEEARAKVGYLPERPYFHEHLTGENLLIYFGKLSGMSKKLILERIPIVLKQVGMSAARTIELRKYSKGMLQRIGIAQALIHDPEFLVLDEPMSGLDPVGRREIRELILKLATEGKTIFFSTHVIPDAEAICDQVGIIQRGRLIASGPLAELAKQGGPVRTEIIFSGISKSVIDASDQIISLQELPDGIRCEIQSEEFADQLASKILQQGGHIISLNLMRPSLESLFEKSDQSVTGLEFVRGLE